MVIGWGGLEGVGEEVEEDWEMGGEEKEGRGRGLGGKGRLEGEEGKG